MTSNKAQKQAIRDRMAKTGERYATARHYLLDHHLTPSDDNAAEPIPEPKPVTAELPPRVAEPGVSDDAVQRATGKTWDEWFTLLDGWEGTARTHPEIARHLAEFHGIDGWWAQSVTVGYERARGMRAIHQQADGFSVSASNTVSVPMERLFAAFVDEATRDGWLEPGTLRPRTSQPHRTARFDVLANGTRIEVYFTAKSDSKSSVQIQHVKLPVIEDVEPWRAFWKERLARLATMLTAD
ncbi:MAG: hypothetical protein ACRDJW_14975 [Thermomicrobiales bacterium]